RRWGRGSACGTSWLPLSSGPIWRACARFNRLEKSALVQGLRGRRRKGCSRLGRHEAGRRPAIGVVLHDAHWPPLRIEPYLSDAGTVPDALALPARVGQVRREDEIAALGKPI